MSAPVAAPRSRASAERTLRILAIEDNPGDAVLVREMLRECAAPDYDLQIASRLEDGVRELLDGGWDCVLLDLSLPDAHDLDGLGQIRAVAGDLPVVVLSGRADEAVAMRAVAEGAQDYLVKGEVDSRLLTRAIQYAIERKRVEVELAHLALHDQLTGLPNRALFLDRLHQTLGRLRRSGSSAAVLFCDIDRFKLVNDSMGHEAGDRLLCAVAKRLDDVLRPGDTAARFGGDEFIVLCEDVRDAAHAIRIAERVASCLEAPFVLDDDEVFVQASIGIALAEHGARPEVLIRDADAAMYRAKGRGGASFEVFDHGMRDLAVRRLSIENELHRGIDRGELRVHYQPQVRMTTGALVGVEALVRWEHPERGLLAPAEFMTIAEETGLIHRVGAWVLESACRQLATWTAAGIDLTMAVNLSPRQCNHPDIVESVARVLRSTGVDPKRVCMEITETAVMDDLETIAAVLAQLKGLGVTVALDDFGTGSSSLTSLRRLPIDIVKIDRAFVCDAHESEESAAIVAAVISLAHALGLVTVAEGIETLAQVDRLRALGSDDAQGYFFARPAPAAQLGYGLGV